MHEFPPLQWLESSWRPLACHSLTLVISLSVIYWLCFRRHTVPGLKSVIPSFFSTLLVLFATMFLIGTSPRPGFPRLSAPALYFVILWAFAMVGVIRNLAIAHENNELPTMVEGAIICVIVAILAVLMMPAYTPHRFHARWTCMNNLKMIGLGLHNYHDMYQAFPAARSGAPLHSWRVTLLPYLAQKELHNQYDFESAWNVGENDRIARRRIEDYHCPVNESANDGDGYQHTAYAALVGKNTAWPGDRGSQIREIQDGTSNTILVAEAYGLQIPWSEPKDILVDELPVGVNLPGAQPGQSAGWMSSYHYGGTQVLRCDGAVRFLSQKTDKSILRALTTRAGGEDVPDF